MYHRPYTVVLCGTQFDKLGGKLLIIGGRNRAAQRALKSLALERALETILRGTQIRASPGLAARGVETNLCELLRRALPRVSILQRYI